MAYIHSGTAFSIYTEIPTDASSPYSKTIRREDATINADSTYAICFVYAGTIMGAKVYQFRSFKIGTSSYKDAFQGTKTRITNTEYIYKDGHVENSHQVESLPANAQPLSARMGQDTYGSWMFSTAIPVFNSEATFDKSCKSSSITGLFESDILL